MVRLTREGDAEGCQRQTGCIESPKKLTSVVNPKFVEWRRQYMDSVWPVSNYAKGVLDGRFIDALFLSVGKFAI